MNVLQRWRLVKFCESHELDDHLIDDMISYSENIQYLRSLIPESYEAEGRLGEWESKQAEYFTTHFLSWVVASLAEGKGPQRGEEKPYRFSLRSWVQSH